VLLASHRELTATHRGGKVAMTMALDPASADRVERLVVVDITPAKGEVREEFSGYVRGMRRVESEGATTRKACEAILKDYVPVRCARAVILAQDGLAERACTVSADPAFPYDQLPAGRRRQGRLCMAGPARLARGFVRQHRWLSL
jgi:hypothetical protein